MASLSVNPVGSWLVVAIFGIVTVSLTVWSYSYRMRTATGIWSYFALGLRLAAILLCLFAALRPSIVYQEKKKQPTSLIFLVDDSSSMKINDEVGGQSRWETAKRTLDEAKKIAPDLGEEIVLKYYRFDKDLKEDADTSGPGPIGKETSLGSALVETVKRETGQRIASIFVLTDGANNSGLAPLTAASQLRSQSIPIVAVGFGSKDAGIDSRDLSVRDIVAAQTVFVKNQLEVKGTLVARGFANQTVNVDLLIDDKEISGATQSFKVPDGAELIALKGLKYVPETPGEKKITLRVRPMEKEVVPSNNEMSTFVSVLKGGLNVLFIQGPRVSWEYKYFTRSIASSPDIRTVSTVLKVPAQRNKSGLPDEFLTPGQFDVYVLSDLPPNHLTPKQISQLATAVEKGAGVMMLGGRSSFGMGGWGKTALAPFLPVEMSDKDADLEPEGGIRFAPNPLALESYLLQIGRNQEESAKLWSLLPPLTGINHLGAPKLNANVLGVSAANPKEVIMVAGGSAGGRSLAFAGETWNWARTLEGIPAHKKFWRQVVFWLSHKEDQGENEVKIAIDSRRISLGQTLDFGVTAQDANGSPLTGIRYEAKVEKDGDPADKPGEKVGVFSQGDRMRGSVSTARSTPGDYRVSVVAFKDNQEIGRDSSRFLIYQDDLELDNPAADRVLLQQIAQTTNGQLLAPEELAKYLRSLKGKVFTESLSEIERKLWDNWPFLLLFTTILTVEWWLRKRHGWV